MASATGTTATTTQQGTLDLTLHSYGIGIGTRNSKQQIIEVYFAVLDINPHKDLAAALVNNFHLDDKNTSIEISAQQLSAFSECLSDAGHEELKGQLKTLQQSTQPLVLTVLVSDAAPESVAEVYLKLHLLSHRLCLPHSLNLTGAFGILHNIAWTSKGAIALEDLATRQLQARLAGEVIEVMSVDKFPKMTNYVVPKGVRIAHTARVRLGAYVGEGTTVMHEGFINFNAGTLGTAMIEGRISSGVVVGEGSDLGGGCSTMGTLSGGGTEIISVGKDCLIGANAGLGFPLGDRCIIEAGLYVTAGTKVQLLDADNKVVKIVKARQLSSQADLLFRRNSLTGAVECKTNKSSITLNEELHGHN